MPDNNLDSSSRQSLFPPNRRLFPKIQHALALSSSSKSDTSSFEHNSHDIFHKYESYRRASNGEGLNSQASSSQNEKFFSSPEPEEAGNATEHSHHREGLPNRTKLDPQILQAVSATVQAENDGISKLETLGKFKYASLYEAAARLINGETDTGTIFGVSNMDEYSKFVELSRIDQAISDEVNKEKDTRKANLLSVVDTNELEQRYGAFQSDVNSTKATRRAKLRWPAFSWPKNRESLDTETSNGDLRRDSKFDEHSSYLLHRTLKVRHLQMISFGGTLGVGLYLNSGKAITIAGGLGTVLAFIIVGLIVLATVISFCEMVTFVSVVDGVSGLASRFVDESFGFSAGWLYFCSFSFGLAGEMVASVIILSFFPDTKILVNAGATAGFTTLFILLCVLSNMISVRVFGEIEYLFSLLKVIATLLGIIIMIVINRGGMGKEGAIGFRYWKHLDSDFDHNLIFGPFRPTFDLKSNGLNSSTDGIGGDTGRFLSILVATVVASYAYSGTEIVCIAACEAKDPRKALPSATKRVFWRILLFYCLASFAVSLNIYAGDPRLLRYYSGMTGISPESFNSSYAIEYVGGVNCGTSYTVIGGVGNGSQSPWVVAFQSVGLCNWSKVATVFLFLFAFSCGTSHLYVSSRTVYSLALQGKAPSFLRRCNRAGIPYCAVLFSVTPSLLAYTTISQLATTVFQNLTSVISSAGVFVWFAMCLSYVRFYYGLKKRPDIIGRDDKAYPYKSPFQPYSAIFGLIGSSVILLSMGFVVFLKNMWSTMFFFSSYGTLILFAILYIGHRLIKGSSFTALEAIDFDSGRREKDMYIWDGGKEYNPRRVKDLTHKIVGFMA